MRPLCLPLIVGHLPGQVLHVTTHGLCHGKNELRVESESERQSGTEVESCLRLGEDDLVGTRRLELGRVLDVDGAGQDGRLRVFVSKRFDGGNGPLPCRVAYRDALRPVDARRVKDLGPRSIAVEHVETRFLSSDDPRDGHIEGHVRDLEHLEHVGNGLADVSEAADQDWVFDVEALRAPIASAFLLLDQIGDKPSRLGEQRRRRHRQDDYDDEQLVEILWQHLELGCECQQHEGKLSALRQKESRLDRVRLGESDRRSDERDDRRLEREEPHEETQHRRPFPNEQSHVQRSACRHKEETEEEPTEWLDVRLDLRLEVGLGEQHARHKRPQRIGKPCLLRQ